MVLHRGKPVVLNRGNRAVLKREILQSVSQVRGLANGRPEDICDLGRALLGSLRNTGGSQPTQRGCVLQFDLPYIFAPNIALFM